MRYKIPKLGKMIAALMAFPVCLQAVFPPGVLADTPADNTLIQAFAAYYPYHHKVRARLDFSKLPAPQNVKQAQFVLTRQGESTPIASKAVTHFKGIPRRRYPATPDNPFAAEIILDTPDLKSGIYQVAVTLQGEGVPAAPIIATFERREWEWEHSDIGTARKIVPPFTPLQVRSDAKNKRTSVESVLRSHIVNDFGLWNQVTSKGLDLLAAPLRFEATANNKPVKWTATPIKFTEKSADRVISSTSFSGGPIKAGVLCEWDYDGMMRVTLDIAPDAAKSEVQSLDLVIPLKDEIAPLLHWSSDSIRYNYAGKMPEGNGVIWSSKGANANPGTNIWGTFLPYVFLGGPERGVCWFANNDRDWSLDDDKAALDITRASGVLQMRVHLFNKPTKLDRARRIVFGLQATPAKPMPATQNGKTWRAAAFTLYPNSVIHTIIGNAMGWGGEEADLSIYPRKKDMALFEELARGRKIKNMNMGWVDSSGWLDGYQDQTKRGDYRSDIIGAFGSAGGSEKVIAYTNPRGAEDSKLMPESLNYNPRPLKADEWNEPVRSFQDFSIFYFQKMLASDAIDGIYYDNAYLYANLDTISGDAYIRDDGKVQPGMGLFSMREQFKRTATMSYELGKPPLTMAHMTNSNIIPFLSFATFSLTHEDKYGATDFQDRWSLDYLLAESIGRQAGLIPLTIGGVISKDPKELAWATRTLFGVAAVHELKPWGYYDSDELHRGNIPLYKFGYGLEDCRVYPYWEGAQPVTISGGETKSLVLSRGGKALVIVTDFKDGGDLTMMVDAKKLGLPAEFKAKDEQSGEVLPVADGAIKFSLKRHDYRMFALE